MATQTLIMTGSIDSESILRLTAVGNVAKPAIKTETQPQQKSRRTRKTHTKARTGCLTCKIRRKKCDETRPACARCTSTGRKCDGYAAPSPAIKDDSVLANASIVTSNTTSPSAAIASSCSSPETEQLMLGSSTDREISSPSSAYTCFQRKQGTLLDLSGPEDSLEPIHRHLKFIPFLYRGPNTILSGNSGSYSSLETSCFDYFRYVTGPTFASYFDSSIWRKTITRAALSHPVVMQAAAACGAVHRRFGMGITRQAFEYCEHASKLHAKALRTLKSLETVASIHDRDAIMMARMVLSLFEGFQGNFSAALENLGRGMKLLLCRPMTLLHSESRHCSVNVAPNTFRDLFHQLNCRAVQLFGSQSKILAYWTKGNILPDIPDVFDSLEQARDYLFTEVEWIMHGTARESVTVGDQSEAQILHVTRLLKWSVTYANTIRSMPNRTSEEKQMCSLMKLVRNAAYLLLYLLLFIQVETPSPPLPNIDEEIDDVPDQTQSLKLSNQELWSTLQSRDDLNTNLARVVVLVDSVLDEKGIFSYDEHSVSFDSGVGPPRMPDPEESASTKTRHRVKSLLVERHGIDSLWEILGVYGVAERLSSLEEHAVISSIRSILPTEIDPKWVDITCLMESRKLLLRYCRPDEFGAGMIWTQEWWAF